MKKEDRLPTLGIIVLAAGLGKRMKSDKAKVLHEISGRPMIDYVVSAATQVAGSNVVVVVGHQAEQVKHTVSRSYDVLFALQTKQLGTGHAVLCALPTLPVGVRNVVVLCGDVPLIRSSTIRKIITDHEVNSRDLTVLAVELINPTGYGRIIRDSKGALREIVEQADADDAQKDIKLINTGIYAINRMFLEEVLPQLCTDNAQNEIYLTDIVGFGYRKGANIGTIIGDDAKEILGVNSQQDLKNIEKIIKIVG